MTPTTPLALDEYRRIYETAHSVIVAAGGRPHQACQFFAALGTILLNERYGLPATFSAGVALFNFGEKQPLCFGRPTQAGWISDPRHYHAWVEVDGFAIDFMSPMFPDVVRELGGPASPRLAFQMPIEAMAEDFITLHERIGAFGLTLDDVVARAVLEEFDADPVHAELLSVALDWFERPELSMRDRVMTLPNGKVLRLALKAPPIEGDFRDLLLS